MVSPIQRYDYMPPEGNQVWAPVYRQATAAPNTKVIWVELAGCQTSPAEIFEPTFDEGSKVDNIRVSNERYEQARKVCSTCPVFTSCYTKASESDFFYTTRAGVKPTQLVRYEAEGKLTYLSEAVKDRCAKGHNNWKVWGKKNPRRKCATCNQEALAAARAAKDATLEV